MGALKLLQQERSECLDRQLDRCRKTYLLGLKTGVVRRFLIENGIYDLADVTEEDIYRYREYIYSLKSLYGLQKKQEATYLETCVWYGLTDDYPAFREMVMGEGSGASERRKAGTFLIINGLYDTDNIDCELKDRYSVYLSRTIAGNKVREYLKMMDVLKLEAIRRENENRPFVERKLKYDGKKLYLGFHTDYETAMGFYKIQKKDWLIYDFPKMKSQTVCRQIIDILNWVLKEKTNIKVRNDLYLKPLNRFFKYCISASIDDLELMEEEDFSGYRLSLIGNVGTKEQEYYQVVNMLLKHLFIVSDKPRWEANAWYLERFTFKYDRFNPARPVTRLTFWQIRDTVNRDLFKDYVRYELGLTSEALDTIRARYIYIKEFLTFCDDMEYSAKDLDKKIFDEYSSMLNMKGNAEATFNKAIGSVFKFWDYLYSKGEAKRPDIYPGYYLKKVIYKHNDLSVSAENQARVIKALQKAPEDIRLMFLNMWATGIRGNEVCTIQANAYMCEDDQAFMLVNQYKMKREKLIPIPMSLYEVMRDYITRIGKKGDEFVFNGQGGVKPFSPSYLSKRIKDLLKDDGVMDELYHYRSHGYRHGTATRFFSAGVILQAIREYLGHESEDMTKQYIDHMGDRIRNDSYEFFEKRGSIYGTGKQDKD